MRWKGYRVKPNLFLVGHGGERVCDRRMCVYYLHMYWGE